LLNIFKVANRQNESIAEGKEQDIVMFELVDKTINVAIDA